MKGQENQKRRVIFILAICQAGCNPSISEIYTPMSTHTIPEEDSTHPSLPNILVQKIYRRGDFKHILAAVRLKKFMFLTLMYSSSSWNTQCLVQNPEIDHFRTPWYKIYIRGDFKLTDGITALSHTSWHTPPHHWIAAGRSRSLQQWSVSLSYVSLFLPSSFWAVWILQLPLRTPYYCHNTQVCNLISHTPDLSTADSPESPCTATG